MSLARRSTRSSDADYEHASNLDLNEYSDHAPNGHHDTASIVSHDPEDASLLASVEAAMTKLKHIHGDTSNWDKALKHKHGVDVHVRKDTVNLDGKQKKVPLYKGELLMEGFSPSAVFAIAAQRKLWDDWYDSGNLVADLNDSTSLTYMVMKPPGTARARDIALVEKVEATSDGTIYFVATSIISNKVPHVHGRTRATLILNGWVLRPIHNNGQISTKTSYYLQAEPVGLLPSTMANKILAKRPVGLYKILEYLKKNGPPEVNGAASNQHGQDEKKMNGHANGGAVAGTAAAVAGGAGAAAILSEKQRHEGNTSSTIVHDAGDLESSLPPQAPFDDSHPSSEELKTAKRKFSEALSSTSWTQAKDSKGISIYFKTTSQGSLPIIRGKATIRGVTTEQVLGTIASTSAKRIWDEQYHSTEMKENVIASGEQSVLNERRKGIHPHLGTQEYNIARGVMRGDSNSENGLIDYLSRSLESDKAGNMDFSGYRISPQNDIVDIEYVSSRTLPKQVPEFVNRIITTSESTNPHRLAQFIDTHGFAPYWLRWGKGNAVLDEEIEGDLKQGKTSWRVKGGDSKNGDEKQVAWLQWSEKMYPRGISLTTSTTTESMKPSLVEGFETTVQLSFTGSIPSEGLVLSIESGNGSDSSSATWNGQAVSERTSAPKGAGAGQKRSNAVKGAAAGATVAAGAGAVAASQSWSKDQSESESQPSAVGSIAPKQTSKDIPGNGGITEGNGPTIPQASTQTVVEKRLAVPEDAMLILTQDLYFTRAQMAVIGTLMTLVWALTRFG